jgi:peroxiredoxin
MERTGEPRAGRPAPGFRGICSDGRTRSLADYSGQNLLLVFLRHLG